MCAVNKTLNDDLVVTLDIDWSPDFAIDFVAERLIAHRICATWFVTHLSPAVARLQQHPELFELGIHPNFLPGSTHGDTPDAVLRHCMALVPEATSMRTHALVQSTPLLEKILTQTAIVTDVSLFLPHTRCLSPVEYRWKGRTMLRIPYYWEDDFEMERSVPCWDLAPLLEVGKGLKVFAFHPIHVYLNSADIGPYQALKQRVRRLSEASQTEVDTYVQTGEGAQRLFMELVGHLAMAGRLLCIRDIYKRWHRGEA